MLSTPHQNGASPSLDSTPLSLDALASAPSPSEALSRLSPDALAALSGRCATIQSAIQLAIITRTASAPIDHATGNGLSVEQHARLEQVHVELDRYWDLLRQRRAREELGLNPDFVALRDEKTVENFEQ